MVLAEELEMIGQECFVLYGRMGIRKSIEGKVFPYAPVG